MKQASSLWQWAGFGVATLSGTILHFLYDWTGGSILIAPFSGVNESVWEHMKLLFWPLFLFAVIQRMFFREQENFWWVKLQSILLGLLLIPVLFYTCNGAFGKSPDWLNIAIFYICAGAVFLFERWALQNIHASGGWASSSSVWWGRCSWCSPLRRPGFPCFRIPSRVPTEYLHEKCRR